MSIHCLTTFYFFYSIKVIHSNIIRPEVSQMRRKLNYAPAILTRGRICGNIEYNNTSCTLIYIGLY